MFENLFQTAMFKAFPSPDLFGNSLLNRENIRNVFPGVTSQSRKKDYFTRTLNTSILKKIITSIIFQVD